MDNTEFEFDQELKVKESISNLQDNIDLLESCLSETSKIMTIIANKEGDSSKRLDEYKKIYLQLENQIAQNKKVLSNYKLGLAKLEREVNNRPD